MRGLVTITQESNISDWLWLWEEYASYEARTRECPNGKYSYEWFMYASDALLEKIGVRTEGCVVPTSSRTFGIVDTNKFMMAKMSRS